MISLDSTLATKPDGGAYARHVDYAARTGHLTIVVYTPINADTPAPNTEHLTIIPTRSMSRFTYVFDALRLAAREVRRQKPDLITTQDPFSTGLVGWLLRKWFRVPVMVQNHCYFIDNRAWLNERPLKHGAFNALGKFTSRRADVYRTVNKTERETYLQHGGDPQRVFTQPLGTASAAFTTPPPADLVDETRAMLGLEPHHKVILWVGYPVPFKRVPVLLEVFKRVVEQEPDARLLVIGDMAQSADDLPAIAKRLGISDWVVMHGPVPHGELPAYYALSRIFAMTSAYEGIPRVLMEASAAGLPLVGMSNVGVRDVIEEGMSGYTVPDMDIDGMAAKLAELLREPDKAQQMGAAAKERALARFGAQRNAEGVAEMWQQTAQMGLRG